MTQLIRKLVLSFLIVAFIPATALAQNATVSGTIVDDQDEPLPGANVVTTIDGTNFGAASAPDGTYEFTISEEYVQGQEVEFEANFVGFRAATATLELTPGEHTLNFVLEEDVFRMQDVVVTGVADETPRERLSFSVGTVSAEDLDIAPPQSGVMGSLAGRVAGANVVQTSGNPRGEADILLRGATSIERGNAPLVVIDGVIVPNASEGIGGAPGAGGTIDFSALDVRNVEIIKGAAAASMYGSRAQAGVIQIETYRGSEGPLDQTQVRWRSEVGANFLANPPETNTHHWKMVNDPNNPTAYLDAEGNEVANYWEAANDNTRGVTISDRPFPEQTYNHVDQITEQRLNYRNQLSVSQNTATTNYYLSLGMTENPGIIHAMRGPSTQNARLNVDQDVTDRFRVSGSFSYSRSESDDPQALTGGMNPFYDVWFFPASINLQQRGDDGVVTQVFPDDPDQQLQENPVYSLENRDQNYARGRFQGSIDTRFSPAEWVDLSAQFGYDRSDRKSDVFYPLDYQTVDPSFTNDGVLQIRNTVEEGLNASATATFRYSLGELTGRTRVRSQLEQSEVSYEFGESQNFVAGGVRRLGIGQQDTDDDTFSQHHEINNVGYFLISDLAFRDRYIVDFTVRRDGSSLFGPEQRWHTYGRVSGSYRIAEEPWWPLDEIGEFRLRASYGTAGNRPNFADQYEQFEISGGTVTKSQLGNRNLRPELATEQEYGLNMQFLNRFNLELTYAHTDVTDQILPLPPPAYSGFESIVLNAGDLQSRTIEAELSAILLRTDQQSLVANVVFDRTRQEITRFDRPEYRTGTENLFLNAVGENFANLYGDRWATSTGDLPDHLSGESGQFAVNDDGYLVPVGNHSWQDGISEGLWGTTVEIGDELYDWGMPILAWEDGEPAENVVIGNTAPNFNVGLNLNYQLGNFSVNMLWQSEQGFDVYNHTSQWAYRDGYHGAFDQGDKPEGERKPNAYYSQLYNINDGSSHFVEDGSYVRLRELGVNYTFDQEQLLNWFGAQMVNQVSLGITGRNLLTFTNYSGFDPEVGGTLRRVDSFQYPQFRNITGRLALQF